jgi:hypothetical protein
VHDIWCRRHALDDWRFQIMVDEGDAEEWRSRRDERIRLPVTALGSIHPTGVPYLRPEVQLYGKAKQPRPKDIEDLHQTLPGLDAAARNWLAQSIRQTFGGHHPWLALVEAPAPRSSTSSIGALLSWLSRRCALDPNGNANTPTTAASALT